jgi:hypothetical protein
LNSLNNFLEFRIEKLIPDPSIPVDLAAICDQLGAVVEEREMIPEAAIQVNDGRLHIYLQSNFRDAPGARVRQRFSLAHELGHALFYDQESGEIKPRKDSPRGDKLEAACHKAASMILIPSKALRREIKRQPPSNAAAVIELATRFEVSAEVMLRRLQDFTVFDHDWTAVLTRHHRSGMTIEFAPYPPWLRSRVAKPTRGSQFNEWFRGTERPGGRFTKDTYGGVLEALPVRLTEFSTIFEVRVRTDVDDEPPEI